MRYFNGFTEVLGILYAFNIRFAGVIVVGWCIVRFRTDYARIERNKKSIWAEKREKIDSNYKTLGDKS